MTREVWPDRERVTERALELVVTTVRAHAAGRGRCSLVLAGGSTPKALYTQLAHVDLPWDALHIFWGDERYVPPDHPDSNYRMAQEAWLSQVPIPRDQIYPMPTDEPDPRTAAGRYEAAIHQFFGSQPGDWPRFDLVLLGLGDDGHTASLFPHTAALQVCDRLVTVGERQGQPRLTLSIPVLNRAEQVIFLVTGASKRPAVTEVWADVGNPEAYPARFIQPEGELIWLLDQEAAPTV